MLLYTNSSLPQCLLVSQRVSLDCHMWYCILKDLIYNCVCISEVMLYQDLKEGLDKEPAKNILKYLGFDVQPEKAQEVGQKIWEFYLHNDTISYGTNLVKLAEVRVSVSLIFI